jgi:hypothetical protein
MEEENQRETIHDLIFEYEPDQEDFNKACRIYFQSLNNKVSLKFKDNLDEGDIDMITMWGITAILNKYLEHQIVKPKELLDLYDSLFEYDHDQQEFIHAYNIYFQSLNTKITSKFKDKVYNKDLNMIVIWGIIDTLNYNLKKEALKKDFQRRETQRKEEKLKEKKRNSKKRKEDLK